MTARSTVIEYTAEPTPARFHASDAFVRALMGPVGCVAGDTLVVTETGPRPIASLTQPTRVLSWDATLGRFLLVRASAAFPKGTDALYRVRGPRGEWRGAAHHRVLCADGTYQRLDEIARRGLSSAVGCSADHLATFASGAPRWWPAGARRWWRTLAGWQGRCGSLFRRYDPQLRRLAAGALAWLPQPAGVQQFAAASFPAARSRLDRLFARLATPGCARPAAALPACSSRDAAALVGHTDWSTRAAPQCASTASAPAPGSVRVPSHSHSIVEWPILQLERETVSEAYWDLQVPGTNNYVTADGAIHHNSGKSVTCCVEILRRGMEQTPGPDGVRRTRWAALRQTYPELKSTTIKTWLDWAPTEAFGPIKWDAPITHKVRLLEDCEIEVLFLALERPEDAKKLLSLELTGVWVNEVREMPKAILDAAKARVGRYPGPQQGGCVWSGVIMDTNPPDDDHWLYEMAEGEWPAGFEFFRQPGGRARNAENLNWLMQTKETLALPIDDPRRLAQGRSYYDRIAEGADENWVKVHVDGEYGSIEIGRPVYKGAWNDTLHVAAEELWPFARRPVVLSFDFGLTPAATFCQLTPRGQFRVIDELVATDMGLRQFAENVVVPLMRTKYNTTPLYVTGDPAGVARDYSEDTAFSVLEEVLGEYVEDVGPAATNDLEPRLEAVKWFLTRLTDGRPVFQLSPTCKVLRKGFNGAYKYRRLQVAGDARYTSKPDKNEASHPHDALQYAALYLRGGAPKRERAPDARGVVVADAVAGY